MWFEEINRSKDLAYCGIAGALARVIVGVAAAIGQAPGTQ
jgi:hypothetical protein